MVLTSTLSIVIPLSFVGGRISRTLVVDMARSPNTRSKRSIWKPFGDLPDQTCFRSKPDALVWHRFCPSISKFTFCSIDSTRAVRSNMLTLAHLPVHQNPLRRLLPSLADGCRCHSLRMSSCNIHFFAQASISRSGTCRHRKEVRSENSFDTCSTLRSWSVWKCSHQLWKN